MLYCLSNTCISNSALEVYCVKIGNISNQNLEKNEVYVWVFEKKMVSFCICQPPLKIILASGTDVVLFKKQNAVSKHALNITVIRKEGHSPPLSRNCEYVNQGFYNMGVLKFF